MKPTTPRVALTIAGSDPSGGAGVQADLKTFHQFGVYGEAVITLLTVQNTLRVSRVECIPADLVIQQLKAVLEDIPPNAAKTGALGCIEIVSAIADLAAEFRFPLVVDPVMISKHGAPLLPVDARRALAARLVPRAYLITPNLPEAEDLTGLSVRDLDDMHRAAGRLLEMGATAVLIKGGHLPGTSTDLLVSGSESHELAAERIDTPHTHGTGCTYSAAITAQLAGGVPLVDAVFRAKAFMTEAIRTAPGLGGGSGPVNHHVAVPKR